MRIGRLEILRRLAGRPRSVDKRLIQIASLHRTLLKTATTSTRLPEWSQSVADDLELRQIANAMADPRAIGEIDSLMSASDDLLLTDLASDTAGTGKVALSTYHNAKGRTFTAVILPGLAEGVVPPWTGPPWDRRPLRGPKLEEERRNFYVALTRSRRSVQLQLSPTGLDTTRRAIEYGYSTFARELAASLGQSI